MPRSTRFAMAVLVVLTMPLAIVADEPEAPVDAKSTPWAALRAELRTQAAKGRPHGFVTAAKRKLHARLPQAVNDALRWLAAHQSPDGRWEAAGFAKWRDGNAVPEPERADGAGLAIYDVGVTGLALNAFLVAGHTGAGDSPLDETVRRGLAFLMSAQDEEGCFGERVVSPTAQFVGYGPYTRRPAPARRSANAPQYPMTRSPKSEKDRKTYVYNHAIATLALVEAHGLTGDEGWRASAQRGLDFIALARNPYFAWRYGVKPGDNDTSVTGWMMLTLRAAWLINRAAERAQAAPVFTLDEEAFDGIQAWLDKMTDPDYGRVGYLQRGSGPIRNLAQIDRFPLEKSEAMTAVGMLARMFGGESARKSKILKLGVGLCRERPPIWNPRDGSIDMIYWHFGTLAMWQVDQRKRFKGYSPGPIWGEWLLALETALIENQRSDGTVAGARGSWDPIGAWGKAGGRVYATALNTLTLLTPLRFAPLGH